MRFSLCILNAIKANFSSSSIRVCVSSCLMYWQKIKNKISTFNTCWKYKTICQYWFSYRSLHKISNTTIFTFYERYNFTPMFKIVINYFSNCFKCDNSEFLLVSIWIILIILSFWKPSLPFDASIISLKLNFLFINKIL